jgi:hypothetical protein
MICSFPEKVFLRSRHSKSEPSSGKEGVDFRGVLPLLAVLYLSSLSLFMGI